MSDTSLQRVDSVLTDTSKRLLSTHQPSEVLRVLSDALSQHWSGAAVTAIAIDGVGRLEAKDDVNWPKPLRSALNYGLITPSTPGWSGLVEDGAPQWLSTDVLEQFDLTTIDARQIQFAGQVLGYVIIGLGADSGRPLPGIVDLWLAQAGAMLANFELQRRLADSTSLQESMTSGLMAVDHLGVITSANRSVLELLSGTNLVGGKLEDCFKEQEGRINFDVSPGRIATAASTGRELTFYGEVSEAGEVVRHLQLIVSPLGGSALAGSMVTIRDVTPLIEKTIEANEAVGRAQRHTRELSEMADIAELTSVFGFELEEIYNKFLGKLASLMQSPKAVLYLYQPAQQKLYFKAGLPATDFPKEIELSSSHPIARAFVTKKATTYKSDQNELVLPISVHSKVLGVVCVSGRQKVYLDHDVRLISLVTARLAVLIENARLYHDVNARRERWEAVFQFTDEGIVIFDRKGLIVGFNPASVGLTKYSPREAIGQHFSRVVRIITAEGHNLQITPIYQVLNEAKTLTKIEQLIETKNGDRIWTESSYSPIFDNAGRVTSGIVIMRNIQKDREVEEIKSDFISIVSHELRTPLSAIKGFLDMILKKDFGSLNDKQFHYLTRVYQSNQRMIDLVEDLLDVSYIESGKINLNQHPIAPEAIITDVVTELAAKGFEKQITLKVNRKQRLPLVLADDTRLRQILVNLVDNAIKYSFPKSEVVIDFKVSGDELITTVTDNGVGVSPAQVDRIFQKFGRIYNPMSIQAGGTGLGLYIVKRLVESHGGRIWVSTRGEGKGAKFSFSLPVAKQLPLI